jgi:hypothetical protein
VYGSSRRTFSSHLVNESESCTSERTSLRTHVHWVLCIVLLCTTFPRSLYGPFG